MNLPCRGIDNAKVKFNVCLLQLTGKLKHKVFSNTATGFEQLQQWLEKYEVMRKLIHIAYGVLKSGRPFDPELAKSA